MKNITSLALAGALTTAVASGAVTKPVGYETLPIDVNFNYVGLRLHEATVTTGTLAGAAGTTLTVADGVADALTPGTTYLIEITSGSADVEGVVDQIASFDAGADTITTTADLTGLAGWTGTETFDIRPVATVASVFGADNSAGLTEGATFATADQLWFFNGGGFDKYFYNPGGGFGATEGWKNEAGADVVASDIEIAYTEGFIIFSQAGTDVTVTGEVKLGQTKLPALTGFNYLSSVYPTGDPLLPANPSTIDTLFGSANEAGFLEGATFATADQLWIFNGAGFNKYFYNPGGGFGATEGWKNEAGADVDPTLIVVPSGYLVFSQGDKNVTATPPAGYATL